MAVARLHQDYKNNGHPSPVARSNGLQDEHVCRSEFAISNQIREEKTQKQTLNCWGTRLQHAQDTEGQWQQQWSHEMLKLLEVECYFWFLDQLTLNYYCRAHPFKYLNFVTQWTGWWCSHGVGSEINTCYFIHGITISWALPNIRGIMIQSEGCGWWTMVQDDNYMFVVPLPPNQPLRSDRSRGGGRDWMDGGGSFECARKGDTTRNLSKNWMRARGGGVAPELTSSFLLTSCWGSVDSALMDRANLS